MNAHFTATLVCDESCLIWDRNWEVSIMMNDEDTAPGAPITTPFQAETTVDIKSDDAERAMKEAAELMESAGWEIVGDWEAVPVGYIAPVKRA